MARPGTVLSREHATRLRGLICEHAFRHIFAPLADDGLVALRTRRVDLERYRQEKDEWEKWSSEQFEAEAQLMRPLPGGWRFLCPLPSPRLNWSVVRQIALCVKECRLREGRSFQAESRP